MSKMDLRKTGSGAKGMSRRERLTRGFYRGCSWRIGKDAICPRSSEWFFYGCGKGGSFSG